MKLTGKQNEELEAALNGARPFRPMWSVGFRAGYTAAATRECVWTWDDDANHWETQCERHHDSLMRHHCLKSGEVTFCPHCAGKVVDSSATKQ